MRMKKLFFFAAIAAIAVSCAKTSEIKPVSEQSIGFDTWTSNLTKSPHLGFPTGAKFDVFGYKQTGETKTTAFNGDDVTYDGEAWNYSNVQFWDRTTDSYTFFAIAPANIVPVDPENLTVPAQNGLFVTNDITFDGKNNDVMIAKKTTVIKDNYGLEVGLVFYPKAALFDLKFKKAKNLKEASVTINSVSITNIQTKGHLTVSKYEGDNTPLVTWSVASSPATDDFDNTHGITPVSMPVTIAKGTEHGTNNSEFLINNLIVMPQTLVDGAQQLTIDYTVTASGKNFNKTRTIDLNQFDLTDMTDGGREEDDQNVEPFLTSWEAGKHYTYYLTINADIIVFSATISDWTDVNAFRYIIN